MSKRNAVDQAVLEQLDQCQRPGRESSVVAAKSFSVISSGRVADRQLLDRYIPTRDPIAEARTIRAANVAHDATTAQPDWVVTRVRHLHDTGQLATVNIVDLAADIARQAVAIDAGGGPAPDPQLQPAAARPVEMPEL